MGFLGRFMPGRDLPRMIMPQNTYSQRNRSSTKVNDKMRNPFRRKSKKTEEAPKQA
jgi:hypothetical protein